MWPSPLANIKAERGRAARTIHRDARNASGDKRQQQGDAAASPASHTPKVNVGSGKKRASRARIARNRRIVDRQETGRRLVGHVHGDDDSHCHPRAAKSRAGMGSESFMG